MHKLFFGFLFLLAVTSLQGQQYMIRYDLHNLKRNYYKISTDTVPVKSIDVKKNGRIILSIDNFNPFYWSAKVTAIKNLVQEESGYSTAFNPISFLAQGFGELMSGIPLLDLPKSRGNNGTDANSRFLNTVSSYVKHYTKVQELSEKMDELQVVKFQLKELKYDFSKSENKIKDQARELVQKALGTDSVDLLNLISLGKELNQDYTNSVEELKTINGELQQSVLATDAETRIEGKTFKEIANRAGSSYSSLLKFISLQEKNPNFFIEEVFEVGNLYREISNADFHFKYAVNSESDLSHLKLQLFPKASNESVDTLVQMFELKGKRNLKIRNSVGAAFTYFTANNTNYFIAPDSTIQKSGKDLFNPLISTFIHFYTGNTSGFTWGGSFGIGIPLTGEKKDINFLLGLTTAFGQNEPILLSVGVSGAKVNKLTNGYQLGQKTREISSEKLVSSGYDLGAFISIGFNLGSLNRK